MVTICICSSVHGFRDDSVDLTVEEGTTEQSITITLDAKGNSFDGDDPATIFTFQFQITCLGSSRDVNIRVPGKSLYSSMAFQTHLL